MVKNIFSKVLVIVIILLLIGVSVISGSNVSIKDKGYKKIVEESNILDSLISTKFLEIPDNIDDGRELIKKYVDLYYEKNTFYELFIIGPNMKTISDITYQKGSFLRNSMFLFNLILTIIVRFTSIMMPLSRSIVFFVFPNNKIDFTIEFKQDVSEGSRYQYLTNITEMIDFNPTNNTTQIINEKHTVIAEGFYGGLMLIKRNLYLPPSFFIIGDCERYTLIQ